MRTDLSGNVGQIMPSVIEAAGRDPEMAHLLERLGNDRERVCRTIVERALERGEIRQEVADYGLEALIGVTVGPIVFRGSCAGAAYARVRTGPPRRRGHRPYEGLTRTRPRGACAPLGTDTDWIRTSPL